MKSSLTFEHFQTKGDLYRWWISEIIHSEKQVRSMSNNSHFRDPFEKQHGKLVQTLLKSERQNLYHNDWSLWRQLSFKRSLLEICKLLRNFINTLTTNDKYFLLNTDKLTQQIQMQLSQKRKTSSQFFSEFLKSSLNFDIFKKKMTVMNVRWMSKKSRFRRRFQKQRGERVKTLLKS